MTVAEENEILLEDFGASLHVEHDGLGIRLTMVPDDSEDGPSVLLTRAEARKFARRLARFAGGAS